MRASTESVDAAANFARAFEIREVAAVFQHDELGIRNRARDMSGDVERNEIVIAGDHESLAEAGPGFSGIRCDTRSG